MSASCYSSPRPVMLVCLHEVSHSLTVQQQGHHIHILLRTSFSSSTSFLPCQLMWAPAGKPYGKNCTTYIEGKQLTTKSAGLPTGMVMSSLQLDDTSHVLLQSWRNSGLKSCHFIYFIFCCVIRQGSAKMEVFRCFYFPFVLLKESHLTEHLWRV